MKMRVTVTVEKGVMELVKGTDINVSEICEDALIGAFKLYNQGRLMGVGDAQKIIRGDKK